MQKVIGGLLAREFDEFDAKNIAHGVAHEEMYQAAKRLVEMSGDESLRPFVKRMKKRFGKTQDDTLAFGLALYRARLVEVVQEAAE